MSKPIDDVFEFTTNPKNTPLWVPSIQEEISDAYPPKIGTVYKNRGKGSDWVVYTVVEYKKNKVFALSDDNYGVRYSYRKIHDTETEMVYVEWMKDGQLKKPFTRAILRKLKSVVERRRGGR